MADSILNFCRLTHVSTPSMRESEDIYGAVGNGNCIVGKSALIYALFMTDCNYKSSRSHDRTLCPARMG